LAKLVFIYNHLSYTHFGGNGRGLFLCAKKFFKNFFKTTQFYPVN